MSYKFVVFLPHVICFWPKKILPSLILRFHVKSYFSHFFFQICRHCLQWIICFAKYMIQVIWAFRLVYFAWNASMLYKQPIPGGLVWLRCLNLKYTWLQGSSYQIDYMDILMYKVQTPYISKLCNITCAVLVNSYVVSSPIINRFFDPCSWYYYISVLNDL